jgi:hypothetical protein
MPRGRCGPEADTPATRRRVERRRCESDRTTYEPDRSPRRTIRSASALRRDTSAHARTIPACMVEPSGCLPRLGRLPQVVIDDAQFGHEQHCGHAQARVAGCPTTAVADRVAELLFRRCDLRRGRSLRSYLGANYYDEQRRGSERPLSADHDPPHQTSIGHNTRAGGSHPCNQLSLLPS